MADTPRTVMRSAANCAPWIDTPKPRPDSVVPVAPVRVEQPAVPQAVLGPPSVMLPSVLMDPPMIRMPPAPAVPALRFTFSD